MKYSHKRRFFLPATVLVIFVSTVAALSFYSPRASALSGCSQKGTRTVSFTNERGQVIGMGTHPYYQTLRQGNTGSCVASLQRMLNVYCAPGTKLAVDGQFGSKTYRAVKTIQQEIGYGWYYPVHVNGQSISVDGVAGPQTWSILPAFSYWGGNIPC